MTLSPRTHTIALRIWAHCEPLGWDISNADLATALGMSGHVVRAVVAAKGWTQRLRGNGYIHDRSSSRTFHDGPSTLARGDMDARVPIGREE